MGLLTIHHCAHMCVCVCVCLFVQECWELLFDTVDTVHDVVRIATGVLSTLRIKPDRMKAGERSRAGLEQQPGSSSSRAGEQREREQQEGWLGSGGGRVGAEEGKEEQEQEEEEEEGRWGVGGRVLGRMGGGGEAGRRRGSRACTHAPRVPTVLRLTPCA
mgnify:CR=1 FL=1